MSEGNSNLLKLTTDIVTSYVANNSISMAEVPTLVKDVFGTLEHSMSSTPETAAIRGKPPVPVKKSVQEDYIVCLEDGKKFKSLKRHLKTHYNLTPEQYRLKWNLPHNYPMVAPSYVKSRSALAKISGLGRKNTRRKAKKVNTENSSSTSLSPPMKQKSIYKKIKEIDENAAIKESNENEIPNKWRESLNKISNLKFGWDSFNGRPLSKKVLKIAEELLVELHKKNTSLPLLMPGGDGSVQLEFPDADFEILIENTGAIEADHAGNLFKVESNYSQLCDYVEKHRYVFSRSINDRTL